MYDTLVYVDFLKKHGRENYKMWKW